MLRRGAAVIGINLLWRGSAGRPGRVFCRSAMALYQMTKFADSREIMITTQSLSKCPHFYRSHKDARLWQLGTRGTPVFIQYSPCFGLDGFWLDGFRP